MTSSESHVNWDIVDSDVFAEFRGCDAEQIVSAFVTETLADEPNHTRLNTLCEIGQGRFSVQNNREQRQQLFLMFVVREMRARA